ncbi:hypothetical protein, partial [Oleiphilus sp. HI0080]|uniref:hypothetical protein n=1 Tax=Oleiphilus sp. HI0080 TaxID=1822255 RepID=UPI001E543EDE
MHIDKSSIQSKAFYNIPQRDITTMEYDFTQAENLTPEAISALNSSLAEKSPREVLKFAFSHFGNIAIS